MRTQGAHDAASTLPGQTPQPQPSPSRRTREGCCLRKGRPPAPREGTRGVLQAPRAPESVTATRLRCPEPVKLCRLGQGPRAVTFHAPLWITNLCTKETGNGQGSCSPVDMHVAGQPTAVAEVSPTPAGAASVPAWRSPPAHRGAGSADEPARAIGRRHISWEKCPSLRGSGWKHLVKDSLKTAQRASPAR